MLAYPVRPVVLDRRDPVAHEQADDAHRPTRREHEPQSEQGADDVGEEHLDEVAGGERVEEEPVNLGTVPVAENLGGDGWEDPEEAAVANGGRDHVDQVENLDGREVVDREGEEGVYGQQHPQQKSVRKLLQKSRP